MPKPEPKPTPKPEPKPVPKPEPKPAPKPEPKPVPKPEPKPAPKPVSPYGTKLIEDKKSFVVGKKVWHKKFGNGIVVKAGLTTISVQFENHEEHFFANNAIKNEEYFECE